MKIYTKTGDDGTTGLYGAGRLPKNSLRIDAIGDVDELNAVLGQASVDVHAEELIAELNEIQCRLFDLGAELASPGSSKLIWISAADIDRLENSIDGLTEKLPPLRAFVLPGGSQGAAGLHLARTVCRRAERKMVALDFEEPLREETRRFINRLSDWLFTAARFCNISDQIQETEWHPRS